MTTIRSLALLAIASIIAGCASPPHWKDATKASCWDGPGAAKRMMNILSPSFSGGKFDDYVGWMKSRGVDTAHVYVGNQGDGENAGYCIYGGAWDWTVDKGVCDLMRKRIGKLRSEGWAVVVWLMADDSSQWNKAALSDPDRYLRDLKAEGLLDEASTVCVGLELTEYANAAQVARLVEATRKVYKGKVATHHNSRRVDFAALGDVLFYQIEPGASAPQVAAETKRALATGKPVNFFELSRSPARTLSEAALNAGAYGVGNW